jgi:ABC-2 type transport system permease protein
MSAASLTLRQVAAENRAFWRNPAAAFFTFAFPLIFMVVFNVLFGGSVPAGAEFTAADFFTPGIIAFSVITACYTNIAMTITASREEGILKRVRGTPLPAWAYIGGRIGQSILVTILLVVIVSAFGFFAYGVKLPIDRLPFMLAALVLGAATFCALGIAISGFIPNADAAPAVVNLSILPLLFVSNVFIYIEDGILQTISELFPVRHFADALQSIYHPEWAGPLDPLDLVWVAGWGIAGLVVASRTFTWEPRT